MTGAFLFFFFHCRRFCILTPLGRSAVGRTSALIAAQTRTGVNADPWGDCWIEWTAPYAPC